MLWFFSFILHLRNVPPHRMVVDKQCGDETFIWLELMIINNIPVFTLMSVTLNDCTAADILAVRNLPYVRCEDLAAEERILFYIFFCQNCSFISLC